MKEKIHYGNYIQPKGKNYLVLKPACGSKSKKVAGLFSSAYSFNSVDCKTCKKIMKKIEETGEGSPL